MKKSNRKSKIKCVTKRLRSKQFDRSDSGITLIALVVTIIVLLILVGVSIATLTGENGILTQAQNAKIKTEEAMAKEDVGMAWSSCISLYYEDKSRGINKDITEYFSYENLNNYLSENGEIIEGTLEYNEKNIEL